jgi:hypothetical protein
MLAPAQHAHHLLDDVARLFIRPDVIWPILAVPVGIAIRQIRKLRRQARNQNVARAVRGWLTVPAVIDVVSVAEHVDSDGKKFFLASLTYFYRRPDLEMGEYQREFPLKASAQNWVKQFKGCQVMVHVNPKDVAESFLLESDLEGLETHQISAMEIPVQLDSVPALSQGSRFFTALGEQISIAGFAASAMLLAVSIATGGGRKCPHWFLWTGGAMLGIAVLLMIIVQFQGRGDESAKFLLRSYKSWSPPWMRWSLQVTTAAFFLLWPLDHVEIDQPLAAQLWMKALEPHLPYFIACWCFLATASFHTAILRSQEEVRLPANSA